MDERGRPDSVYHNRLKSVRSSNDLTDVLRALKTKKCMSRVHFRRSAKIRPSRVEYLSGLGSDKERLLTSTHPLENAACCICREDIYSIVENARLEMECENASLIIQIGLQADPPAKRSLGTDKRYATFQSIECLTIMSPDFPS